MPYIRLETSAPADQGTRTNLLQALSREVAQGIGKPEQYVMACFEPMIMIMGGKDQPAAYVELKSIGGLTPDVINRLSKNICALLQDMLQVPPARVFLNFSEVPPTHWAWNGETFG
jgi:phenylpyruvate tautomerase